ncbi:MAG TPA: hypothetical protein P5079_03075 [Elusimicrobiota bacterium]|nr:hypothetical protein [Elusimicrobiota bacterium]
MKEKQTLETFRAVLRTTEKQLNELLRDIEQNDVSPETVDLQVRQIEKCLRNIRAA